jgi:hypothetical protein
MIVGSGSGVGYLSISLTNGSGSGPKNIWILRIRIRNTGKQCCGSRMFIVDLYFFYPGSRSKIIKKGERGKVPFLYPLISQNLKVFKFLNRYRKKFECRQIISVCSTQTIVANLWLDPGTEIWDPEITYPGSGSRVQKVNS